MTARRRPAALHRLLQLVPTPRPSARRGGSIASLRSVGSIGSISSRGSAGSIASIASSGCILSVGSHGINGAFFGVPILDLLSGRRGGGSGAPESPDLREPGTRTTGTGPAETGPAGDGADPADR